MAETVRCDICGKLFNSSYLGSHKRLAHRKEVKAAPNEQATVQKIIDLYGSLSPEARKKALQKLSEQK